MLVILCYKVKFAFHKNQKGEGSNPAGDSFHFMIDKVRIKRSFLKYGFIRSGIEHIVNAIVI